MSLMIISATKAHVKTVLSKSEISSLVGSPGYFSKASTIVLAMISIEMKKKKVQCVQMV